jgi:ribose transport system substrate-binding protein
MKAFFLSVLLGLFTLTGLGVVAATPSMAADGKKYKVFVTIGFDGNTWMTAATNLIAAMSKTKDYKDHVASLTIQSARGDAQTQVQQINAAVESGVDILIVWAISPTALNRAVRNACAKGVTVVTYDAAVTEPCVTTHVGIDQDYGGAGPAEGLVKALNGKGNIIFMGGIPGNIVDTRRNEGAKGVFAQYPDIKIIAEVPSMWNPATARQRLTEIVAAKGWDKIDGLWTQTGCYEFTQLQLEAGRTKLLPCSGNGGNGERVIMLPKGSTPGAEDVQGASMGSPVWAGAYAFTLAFKVKDGGTVPKFTEIPMPLVTPENSRLCQKADRAELVKEDWKCTAVPLSVAPDNFYIDVFSKFIPQLDLYSALNGTVPEGQ